jgi:hypothetical protein
MIDGVEPLTDRTVRLVERLFAAADAPRAQGLLVEECGTNLPFCETQDAVALERVRFAVLMLSGGDMTKLRAMVDHAKEDWRDVLVWAGFGYSLTEHDRWAQAVLEP